MLGRTFIVLLVTAFALGSRTREGEAGTITLSAHDSGWYTQLGQHYPDREDHFVGEWGSLVFRNFFVFDLSDVDQEITAAEVRLWLPQGFYVSPDSSETYELFALSTPVSTLLSDHSVNLDASIYSDLGSGTSYGSVEISTADLETFISVQLNSDALSALNSASGLFAIGGAIVTLDDPGAESLFWGLNAYYPSFETRELELSVVPLPPAALAGAALLGCLAAIRRRGRSRRGR